MKNIAICLIWTATFFSVLVPVEGMKRSYAEFEARTMKDWIEIFEPFIRDGILQLGNWGQADPIEFGQATFTHDSTWTGPQWSAANYMTCREELTNYYCSRKNKATPETFRVNMFIGCTQSVGSDPELDNELISQTVLVRPLLHSIHLPKDHGVMSCDFALQIVDYPSARQAEHFGEIAASISNDIGSAYEDLAVQFRQNVKGPWLSIYTNKPFDRYKESNAYLFYRLFIVSLTKTWERVIIKFENSKWPYSEDLLNRIEAATQQETQFLKKRGVNEAIASFTCDGSLKATETRVVRHTDANYFLHASSSASR